MNDTKQSRRGITLVEISVAIVLVGALGTLIVEAQMMRGRLERAMHWRELATVEAGNLMEQVAAMPWDELNDAKLASVKLSEDFQKAVPKAALQLALDPSADQPEGRRIRVEIGWPGPTGEAVRPVRLTSWVYHIASKRTSSPQGPTTDSAPEATAATGEQP